MSKILISEQEQVKINNAVKDLELESSGELVLYLAKKSSNYSAGKWVLSTLFGGLVAVVLAGLGYFWLLPSNLSIFDVSIAVFTIMLIGFLIGMVSPKLRSSLMGSSYTHKKVLAKAHAVFLEKEVFQTVDRTGILIYISSLEKQVVVLGDTGISSVVKAQDWEEVVRHIVQGIKTKNITEGILVYLEICVKMYENTINKLASIITT